MKKIGLMLLITCMVMTAVMGCAKAPLTQEGNDPATSSGTAVGEPLIGKVANIVGNEVQLELGTLPDVEIPEGEVGEGGMAAMTPAVSITANEGSTDSLSEASGDVTGGIFAVEGKDSKGIELTYTGESKTLTIPAGAKISNLAGGESTLAAIKKGSVVMIVTTGEKGSEVVTEVMIMG